MNAHDELLDLVAVYALGALPAQDAAHVREHMAICPECSREYARLQPAVDAVARSAEACTDPRNGAVPSELLKARIMKTVRAEAAPRPASAKSRTLWPAYAVAAAAMLIAMFATVLSMMMQSDLRQSREEVSSLTHQLAGEKKYEAAQRIMIADLMSTDAKRYPVSDGEVVRKGERLYIAMHTMPMPPKGRVYQSWTLAAGAKAMTPGPTFMPDKAGIAIVHVPQSAATLAAVAVSVEPEGGSKSPTSKPEFVVKLI
ncbi:MAG: hypothetical protein DLM50_04380 [Candidatus Meridianibacter frigidus]|nr:MAG: hypothetical protein DLM50_04380 [Candidatus Eremiobacteraeota bacterium]